MPDKTANDGTPGPPSVYDNRSRFPGKIIALQHVFLSRSVEFNSGRRRYIMGKDAKGKGKTFARNIMCH